MIKNKSVQFKHEAEAEFARILDFYRMAWVYEPTIFTLVAPDGHVCYFQPDFYLSSEDRYVEVTVSGQHHARVKRQRMRQMAEQHPEIKITLIDRAAFFALLLKFGRAALAPCILGAAGQLV